MSDPKSLDELREANTRFYKAFESLSLEEMSELWAQDESVRCVHPGWPCLNGWEQVRESWKSLLSNARYLEFDATDLRLWVEGDLGCVFCHENIVTFQDGHVVRTVILATNVFQRRAGRWRMVLHHGSPVLRNAGGGDGGSE